MTNPTGTPVSGEENIELKNVQLPSLTELAKKDPDLKEMIKLICEFNLRNQAIYLIGRKMLQVKTKKPIYAR